MLTRNELIKEVTISFMDLERDRLACELEHLFFREEICEPTLETLTKAMQLSRKFPLAVRTALLGLRSRIDNKLGAVLLRNTPLDRHIPTQPQPTRQWHEKQTCVSEAFHLVVLLAVGTIPISFRQENSGDQVATLFPKIGDEHKQESSGQTFLELHCEDSYHFSSPDILTLSCLQEDGKMEVGTLIASNRLLTPLLSDAEIEIGSRPIYYIDAPCSFKGLDPARSRSRIMPVFSGSREDLQLTFDAHAMHSIEGAGETFLQELKRRLSEVCITVYLRKGDLLILDNRVAAHGRVGFKADFSRPRILQRAFGRFDFAATLPTRRGNSTIIERNI
jgi:L-asparagine oxygenase